MQLTMSNTLTKAIKDADFLQDEILMPLSDQLLGRRCAKGLDPADCPHSNLALGIMGLMEEVAQHKTNDEAIDVRTEMGFTHALAVLMDNPELIPGFSPEVAEVAHDLKARLAMPRSDPAYRPFTKNCGVFHYMSAAILATARARMGDAIDPEDLFPEGSCLNDAYGATKFLINLHAHLQLREKLHSKDVLPELSDKDLEKIRMILDLAEASLPEIDPEDRVNDIKRRVAAIMSDPQAKTFTKTLTL